jgi:hypothetical protein
MQRGHGLFARELVAKKGRIADSDVEAVRAAGFTDGDIAEVDFPSIALRFGRPV